LKAAQNYDGVYKKINSQKLPDQSNTSKKVILKNVDQKKTIFKNLTKSQLHASENSVRAHARRIKWRIHDTNQLFRRPTALPDSRNKRFRSLSHERFLFANGKCHDGKTSVLQIGRLPPSGDTCCCGWNDNCWTASGQQFWVLEGFQKLCTN
jgi:hypothetical protein